MLLVYLNDRIFHLPRQARDTHIGNLKQGDVFVQLCEGWEPAPASRPGAA